MKNDARKALGAIQALIVQDLEGVSDEEIRAEMIEDGNDPELVAREMAEALDSVVSEFLRSKVAATKAVKRAVQAPAQTNRPVLSKIKELVQSAFEVEPTLATAYRKGTKQSDNDWISIYDDLVSLGKVDPEKND